MMKKFVKRTFSFSKDYYKVLGCKKSDPILNIKKNYIKLVKENHPDKGGSREKI